MTKEKSIEEPLLKSENLEKLLDKYANKLIGFINSYVYDVHIAEDIMMDIFVDLLKNKPSLESEQAMCSYLFVCARNKAINYIKKNKRITLLTEDILADTEELENILYNSNLKKILFKTLEKLNINYKTVLYLSYFENMNLKEIEEIMGLNNKQVRNLKNRATKKMNKLLKQQNFYYKGEDL